MKKFIKFFALALVCALSFVGLTACGKKTTTTAGLSDSLKNARDYLTSLYGKTNEDVTVTGDLTRLTSVSVTGGSVEVSWSVSVQESQVKVEAVEGESQVKIVIVDNKNSVGFSFVLTATLTLGEESTSLEWNCVVPAFKELTWAEYYAKKANDVVVVKGVVTALIGKTNSNSYNCIYFEDADGGYYAYGMEADPFTDANLKVGTTIRVSGLKDIYSGTHEIKEATYEILDSTVNAVAAKDISEAVNASKDLKDESLQKLQSKFVTIKGVSILPQDEEVSSGYYKFKTAGGVETYVRISSSVCPLSKADQTTFIAQHAAHVGWTANVTGIVSLYDGLLYITPVTVDALEYVSLPDLNDAGAVAFEKNILAVDAEITSAGVTLPVVGSGYSKVAIAWASSSDLVAINATTGALTFAKEVGEDTEITLTATLTAGDASDTKEFTVTLLADSSDVFFAEPLDAAKVGSFVFAMDARAVGKGFLFATGTLNSKGALEVTDNAAKAANFVVAAVEGKEGAYTIKVGDKYLVAYRNGNYNNLKLADEAGEWAWNADLHTFVATYTYDNNGTETSITVYFGAYLKNGGLSAETMSLSSITYATGNNLNKVDKEQFIGRPVTLTTGAYVLENIEESKAGTYKVAMNVTAVGKGYLFATGTLNSKGALEVTADASKAANFVVAAVEGKQNVYSIKVGDKYLVAYRNGNYNNLKLADEVGEWTWNNDLHTFVATYTYDNNGTETSITVYFGAYLKNGGLSAETMSLSSITYATGNNLNKVDKEQFIGRFGKVSIAETELVAGEKAVAGSYFIGMDARAVGKGFLFATGTLNSKGALETTPYLSKAATFVVAAVEGKQNVYSIKVGDKYLVAYRNGNYNNLKLADEVGEWTWNNDLHTFVATYTYDNNGTETSITVYFGAYLKNGGLSAETMSLSSITYATGNNLNKVDKEQFIGRLGAMGFVSEAEEVEAEVVAIADLTADATKLVKLVDVVVADNAAAKSETVNVVFYSDEACTTVAELSGVYESIEGYAIKATDSQINFYVTESSTPVAVVTLTEPYVLDATLEANKGKGTGYADLNQVTVGGVIWNVGGNTGMNPYRIGGKAIENVDRRVFSGSMISNNISLIAFVLGNANNVTVNSVRVDVYSTLSLAKAGAAGDVYSAAQTFTAGTTIIVERPAGADWSNCYFSITFNLTITASSNKYIELQGIVLNID